MKAEKAFSKFPLGWRLIDQPLSIQFLVAGGVVGFFSLVSLILLLYQVDRQAQASRWLGHTHRTIGRLNTLGRDFYRQQTALLEFLKSHDDRYREQINEYRQLWQEDFHDVRDLMAMNPDKGGEALLRLDENYESWSKLLDALMDGTQPLTSEIVKDESTFFKETFLSIDRMIDSQNRLLSIRDRSEKGAIQATFTAIAGINVVLLVIFGIVLTKLYFSIARPISDLSTGMEVYRGGNFATRVLISNRSQIGFLEASFNEMAEKIENMVFDLRKLDEMKTEFLSMVSHELRTPLTSISGYVRLILAKDAGPITGTQEEFLKIIDVNVVRLTQLINDLLDVEKMESGHIQLVKEPQDLVGILKECCDTFAVVAAQRGLELRTHFPPQMKPILGDRTRLVQAFMNLISNAVKYTHAGFVEVQLLEHDFAVVIRITDSGVGISSEEQHLVFQKFYRARSGLTSSEGGTGLGLVIARNIIEAHGGQISVESQLGRGTTFSVTLPLLAHTHPIASAMTVTLPVQKHKRVPIWIIDSEHKDVVKMSRLIQESRELFPAQNVDVVVFKSINDIPPKEEISIKPILVVLDSQSTGVGTQELPITLLKNKLGQEVPLLAVGSEINAAAAFAEGVSALVTKPLREKEFLIAVKDLVSASGWHVLIADRNMDTRVLTRRSLEQKGLHVDDVDHGGLVLKRLEQDTYDLVLIDLDLPDISGLELVKAIRGDERYSNLPLFMTTENSKESAPSDYWENVGANRLFDKNLGIEEIANSVYRYLEDQEILEHHH